MLDRPTNRWTVLELFAGAGGLATGLDLTGAEPLLFAESHPPAARLLSRAVPGVPILGDVRGQDWSGLHPDAVVGGPPCQPFSLGGKGRAWEDERDMWCEAVRAVREARPAVFAFENVPGLMRPAYADYVSWIVAALARPETPQREGEDRASHLLRLSALPASYSVIVARLNAADHGAAQNRRRVVFLGVRGAGRDLQHLAPLRSSAALARDLRDGCYAQRTGMAQAELCHPALPAREAPDTAALPWVTAREALAGLGEPDGRRGHDPVPGARAYLGHTGSPADWPAKALKAGVHGVPGGENMLRFADGSVRYMTVREAARLAGFSDDLDLAGVPRSEAMRAFGNAVPVPLARAVGDWLAEAIRRG